jgi:hypothetical protein
LLVVLIGAEKKEKISSDEDAREADNSQVSLGSADDGGEVTLVFALDFLDSDDSGGLLVDYGTETGLALDDHIRDTHLAAESGDEDDEFDGIDIMGDDDESGFLGLDEGNDVVKAVFHEQGLLGVLHRPPLSEIIHNENRGILPWRPSPYPQRSRRRQLKDEPSCPAWTRGGTC